MKTLIIGQAPAMNTEGKAAFSGKSGPKFAELLGVEHLRLWDTFDVVNLIDYYPGKPKDKTKRGDAFPMREAKYAAEGMRKLMNERAVVMVGRNVARAFKVHTLDFFDWFVDAAGYGDCGFFRYCVVPHPSGISRYWNDPERVERAKLFMRSIPR